ncbi:uncharacterized protein LOC124174136 isoform X2 [Ischnura elegans]|uniref:uncharacterized protein LOC124174136 isoform X2 n=1 Tax=Ischnura elegans TaxID=197161 RepID=UPI001ED87948|nr:uncharacterized protein LOC124174136 isoform X2 [Ischnura elegans]
MDEDRNDDGRVRRHPKDDKTNGSGSRRSHSLEKKRSQDLYSVKVQKVADDRAPKRLIFDLVEGIPKGSSSHHVNKIETSTQMSDDPNETPHEVRDVYPEIPEKIDVYYFDHGNSAIAH